MSPTAQSEKSQSLSNTAQTSLVISGRTLLMTRIFDSEDPRYDPPVISTFDKYTDFRSCALYLNKNDRQLMAEMYEYAQAQGADLKYVDEFVRSLGFYRQSDGEKVLRPLNSGSDFDREGHMITFSFTPKDAATAKRILDSDALRTTRLDQTFLRHKLNKDRGALDHSSFDFMEQVVKRFSAQGESAPPLDPKFSRYESIKDNVVRHVSTKVYKDKIYKKAGNADPLNTNTTEKKKDPKTKPAAPETLQDTLRRIMSKVLRANSKTGIPSLADFLMKFRR